MIKKEAEKSEGMVEKIKEKIRDLSKANRKLFICCVIGVVVLLTLIGGSYAILSLTLKGEKDLEIVAGTLAIKYADGKKIEMDNFYPMSDKNGMKMEPCEFSIENTGNLRVKYDVSLELGKSKDELDVKYVRYAVREKEGEWSNPASLKEGLVLIEDIEIDPEEKKEYELKLWVDKNTSIEEQGKTFKGKVVVSAVQVNVPTLDATAPVILLAGSTSVNVPQGSRYVDSGVESVRDNKDTLDKSDVKVSYEYYDGSETKEVESIDTSKLGVYYAYYKIKDKSQNEGVAVRSINVYKKDTTPPVITLNGNAIDEIDVDGKYTELGATAIDDIEGDITSRVVTVGVVNTKREGTYYVKYLITDQEGNTASVVRCVIVGEVVIEINLDMVKKPTDKIPEIGGNVTYKSEDETIATVDPDGNVTAKDVGETKVIITKEDGSTKEVIVKVEKTITPEYNAEGPGVIRIENTEGECAINIKGGTCTVVAPDIIVEEGYTIVGWNSDPNAKDGTPPGNNLEIGEGKTYYPITYKNEKTYRVDYSKGSGVSSIGSSSDSCTTNRVYRGDSDSQSCNVTLPAIASLGGYQTGFWSQDASATSGIAAGTSIELTTNTTYYAKALDTTKPYWKVVSVSPSGTVSPGTQVVVTIQGLDTSGSVESSLTAGNITVQVGGVSINPTVKTLSAASNVTNGCQYTLTLGGITAQGALSITIGANTLRDGSGNTNVSLALTPGVSFLRPAADTIFNTTNLGSGGSLDTSDSEQTFITGENPNNYVWYSGKLWRAVSKDTSDNSIKMMTEWPATTISYHENLKKDFKGSHAEKWLNDTSVDGFLGNLRNYSNFIKTNSQWNATQMKKDSLSQKPARTTMVTDTVGLLNAYEYTKSYTGTTAEKGYLNKSVGWYTITPSSTYSASYSLVYGNITGIDDGSLSDFATDHSAGLYPVVNLKSSVGIAGGSGTETDPYRLVGDNDTPVSGTLLSTRYSGEYVRFGSGSNNLYRIVSKEQGATKMVGADSLKESNGSYASSYYEDNSTLEKWFLNVNNGYLTAAQINMIDNKVWYYGRADEGDNYRLAKYTTATSTALISTTVTAKVGLLRYGEQMTGQYTKTGNDFWLSTQYTIASDSLCHRYIDPICTSNSRNCSTASYCDNTKRGVRPAMHLRATVKITGGRGTKEEPFTISL